MTSSRLAAGRRLGWSIAARRSSPLHRGLAATQLARAPSKPHCGEPQHPCGSCFRSGRLFQAAAGAIDSSSSRRHAARSIEICHSTIVCVAAWVLAWVLGAGTPPRPCSPSSSSSSLTSPPYVNLHTARTHARTHTCTSCSRQIKRRAPCRRPEVRIVLDVLARCPRDRPLPGQARGLNRRACAVAALLAQRHASHRAAQICASNAARCSPTPCCA